MKEVLISIQPKWCELIASGKKTIEVRKTRPKIDTPFKVYIYCTQGKDVLAISRYDDKSAFLWDKSDVDRYNADMVRNGKVIGEFVCDRIDHYEMEGYDKSDTVYQDIRRIEGDEEYDIFSLIMEVSNEMSETEITNSKLLKQSCLSFGDIGEYVVANKEFGFYDFYGWHISDLEIYDKPKVLSEFIKPCENDLYCELCAMYSEFEEKCHNGALQIKRPPQSWCYVESKS